MARNSEVARVQGRAEWQPAERSGRVTPSKLRRSAVIAVDGVLALGTGAIGGLFATGTGAASAAAPPVGWSALQSPTVTGPDAPNANPEAELAVHLVRVGRVLRGRRRLPRHRE